MKFKMRSGRTNDDSLSSAGRPSASSVPENSRRVNTNRPSVVRPSPSHPPRPPRPPIPVLGRHRRRRRPRYYDRLRHLPPRRPGRQGSGGQHSLLSNLSAKLVHEVNTKRARGRIDSISSSSSVRPSGPSLSPSKFTRITATALIAVPSSSSWRSHGGRAASERKTSFELSLRDATVDYEWGGGGGALGDSRIAPSSIQSV